MLDVRTVTTQYSPVEVVEEADKVETELDKALLLVT